MTDIPIGARPITDAAWYGLPYATRRTILDLLPDELGDDEPLPASAPIGRLFGWVEDYIRASDGTTITTRRANAIIAALTSSMEADQERRTAHWPVPEAPPEATPERPRDELTADHAAEEAARARAFDELGPMPWDAA